MMCYHRIPGIQGAKKNKTPGQRGLNAEYLGIHEVAKTNKKPGQCYNNNNPVNDPEKLEFSDPLFSEEITRILLSLRVK